MGHALRSGEQRGGRARGQLAPEAERGGQGAAPDNRPGSGLQPPPRRRSRGDLARALVRSPQRRFYLLPVGALCFILTGLFLYTAGQSRLAELLWSAGLAVTGAPVVWQTVRGLFVGRFAADLVAMLAIVTALLLGEPLAGLIVVLMQTGGEALELYAEGRASRAVRDLEAAAPRLAHLITAADLEDIGVDAVAVGYELLV